MIVRGPAAALVLLALGVFSTPAWGRGDAQAAARSSAGQVLTVEEQTRLVREAAAEWAGRQEGAQVEEVRLRNARAIALPPGAGTPSCTLDERRLPSGRTLADLSYSDAQGRLHHRWVQTEVRVLCRAVQLRHEVRRGTMLSADDLLEVEAGNSEVSATPRLQTAAEAVGLIARQPLAAGTLLEKSQLEEPLLVHRGDEVQVVAEKGSLQLTVQGQALEQGCQGRMVPVKLSGGQVLQARVRADHEVEVTF